MLKNGDTFPSLGFETIGRSPLVLPGELAGSFGAVLVYRGAWCPYCRAQLAAFSRAMGPLSELGIKVAALSVDDRATTADLVEKYKLAFPVGYGADCDRVARAIGAFTNDDPRYLQSTGFVLDPAGKVITAVYSTGAIGRLVPDDVVGFVRYVKSHK